MEIKVLGTGCAGCRALYETVCKVVAETGLDATVVKEEEITKILEYGVYSLPALVVDGKVAAAGGRLSAAEVKNCWYDDPPHPSDPPAAHGLQRER